MGAAESCVIARRLSTMPEILWKNPQEDKGQHVAFTAFLVANPSFLSLCFP